MVQYWIAFDKQEGSYKPGDTITGAVYYCPIRPTKVNYITLEIEGFATTGFLAPKIEGSNSYRWFRSKNCLFYNHIRFLNPTEKPVTTISRWTHWRFSHKLPDTLPCSFKGEHGEVKYQAVARMVRPYRLDRVTRRTLDVESPIYCANETPKEANVVAMRFVYPFFNFDHRRKLGCMRLSVTLPKTTFYRDERTKAEISLVNKTDTTVKKIWVELVRVVTYFGVRRFVAGYETTKMTNEETIDKTSYEIEVAPFSTKFVGLTFAMKDTNIDMDNSTISVKHLIKVYVDGHKRVETRHDVRIVSEPPKESKKKETVEEVTEKISGVVVVDKKEEKKQEIKKVEKVEQKKERKKDQEKEKKEETPNKKDVPEKVQENSQEKEKEMEKVVEKEQKKEQEPEPKKQDEQEKEKKPIKEITQDVRKVVLNDKKENDGKEKKQEPEPRKDDEPEKKEQVKEQDQKPELELESISEQEKQDDEEDEDYEIEDAVTDEDDDDFVKINDGSDTPPPNYNDLV